MHHHKLILFGVVLVGVVIFGFLFWDDLKFNQQELANTPVNVTTESDLSMPASDDSVQAEPTASMSSSDDYAAIEKDLAETSLQIDADLAELESELEGL